MNTEYIDVKFEAKLRKDLQENEEICEKCGGLGLQVFNNEYGVRYEGQKINFSNLFPYKKQSLGACQYCYNGVRKRCEHCGDLIEKNFTKCQKEQCKEKRGEASWQKEIEIWNNANKITYEEAIKKYEMLYIDNWSEYIPPEMLLDSIDNWIYFGEHDFPLDEDCREIKNFILNRLRIYGTYNVSAKFNAYDILYEATEELHEEAYFQAKFIIDDMQKCLDEFAKQIENETKTYLPDGNIGIQLTEEDIRDLFE